MTFDYFSHLTIEEVDRPSASEQWVGQYNKFTAVGRKKEKADPLREAWKSQYLQSKQAPGEVITKQEWQYILGLSLNPETSLDCLPANSFLIHFIFVLEKPYLSKEDTDFHIIDNPLVREKIFRWPMVRPSGWKGALRHALWQRGYQDDSKQIQRIFGEIREEDEGRAGRVFFFPTFFERSTLEIMNPHDRKRRVGKTPLLLESVPAGAHGTFSLLYVPFDLIGQDAAKLRSEVAEDLKAVTEGIKAMLTQYGFGAKTSSGFGVADILSGTLTLRTEEAVTLPTPTPSMGETSLPQYLETPDRLKADFLTPQGTLKSEAEYQAFLESQGKQFTKKQRQLYEKAKKWWQSWQQKAEATPQEPRPEPPPQRQWWQRAFKDASDLDQVVEEACRALQQESER
jgi:CRISPR-associated protein Cmr2